MAGHYDKIDVFTTFQGSALYMSPERIKSQPHTYNSDIWSLGVTLAEAALGKPLFSPSDHIFIEQDQSSWMNKLDEFSEEFREFLFSCLQIDPERRPSAKALLSTPFIIKYYDSKPSLKKWMKCKYFKLRDASKSEALKRLRALQDMQ